LRGDIVILFLIMKERVEPMSLEIKSSRVRGLSANRIISRILSLAETPKLQSELLEEILVSRSTLSRYIGFLLDKGLLDEVEMEGKTRLKTNAKGNHYLKTGTIPPKSEDYEREERNESKKNSDSENDSNLENETNQDGKDDINSNNASRSYPNWNITPNIV
jgi:predicted transcriptional regulator